MNCPDCGSSNIRGLMQAFWVPLADNGLSMKYDWGDYECETEIGDERLCADCGHQWEDE